MKTMPEVREVHLQDEPKLQNYTPVDNGNIPAPIRPKSGVIRRKSRAGLAEFKRQFRERLTARDLNNIADLPKRTRTHLFFAAALVVKYESRNELRAFCRGQNSACFEFEERSTERLASGFYNLQGKLSKFGEELPDRNDMNRVIQLLRDRKIEELMEMLGLYLGE
jgi:hypothetical protein